MLTRPLPHDPVFSGVPGSRAEVSRSPPERLRKYTVYVDAPLEVA